MKNIYINILKIILFFILFFFKTTIPNDVLAVDEFMVSTDAKYYFLIDGNANVTNTINLKNNLSTIYAKSYTLIYDNLKPTNVEAFEKGNKLQTIVETNNNKTTIKIVFDDSVIGKDNERNFEVSFLLNDLSTKTGEVWEIIIPKLEMENNFENYNLTMYVPDVYGELSYISPQPTKTLKESSNNIYQFSKSVLSQTNIVAGFGEFQVYNFNISYHLENPLNKSSFVEIPIPPDTSYQKLYYQNITPLPNSIEPDLDGNWIAKYLLTARDRIDVKIEGSVQIMSKSRDLPDVFNKNLDKYLLPTQYWQSKDALILDLASTLKTPENIYNYVVANLKYDYNRAKPNVQRLGARKALEQPDSAICMEFTDLFIALARASNIPAREINGYAYTDNPQIKPLSLISDVLHSWPEYWDTNKKIWIPVDPTWGNTTMGIDYFNKLDMRHFAFVIHGTDPLKPYPPGSYKLGANPQKDVYVSFGKIPENRNPNIDINYKISKLFPLPKVVITVYIKNNGPSALYDLKPKIYFDDKLNYESNLDFVLPFTTQQFNINVPISIFGKDTPENIIVELDNDRLYIKGYKEIALLMSFLILLSFIFILVIFIFIKHHNILNAFKTRIIIYFKKYAKKD